MVNYPGLIRAKRDRKNPANRRTPLESQSSVAVWRYGRREYIDRFFKLSLQRGVETITQSRPRDTQCACGGGLIAIVIDQRLPHRIYRYGL